MFRNIIVRLAIYYLACLVLLDGAARLFPDALFYIAQERNRFLMGTFYGGGSDASEVLESMRQGIGAVGDQDGIAVLVDPAISIPVVLALILAFGVTLPVTWVYRWTRPQKKYSQSFIHALLVTPIGIALVVFLVKGSLPLAFGLAGIVAAVRFRATIKEPMDAVYMLMAIGIGLATGTQLTTVAYLASLMFVAITLAVWKSDYGAKPPVLSGWRIVPPDAAPQVPEAPDKPQGPVRPSAQ